MSVVDVFFEVPARIANGLVTGDMVRRGGVVQWATGSDRGQVVAWLKEVGGLDQLSPAQVPTNVVQQLGQLQFANNALLAGQALNLGVSAMGFAVINAKLKALDRKVQNVLDQLVALHEDIAWLDRRFDMALAARVVGAIETAKVPSFGRSTQGQLSVLQTLNESQRHYHALVQGMLDHDRQYRAAPLYEVYLSGIAVTVVAKARVIEMLEGTTYAAQQLALDTSTLDRALAAFADPVMPGADGWPKVMLAPAVKPTVTMALPVMRETAGRLVGYLSEVEFRAALGLSSKDWEELGTRDEPGIALLVPSS